ncbi:MAG: hypothetical protein WCE68_03325, partial [Anaerolineales bacterium]
MKISKFVSVSRKAVMLALGALMVFGLAFTVPATVAFAAAPAPAVVPVYPWMIKAYQHDMGWLSIQTINLSNANDMDLVITNLITEATAANLNAASITALSNALTSFDDQMATAEASHAAASTLLNDTPANGFTNTGGNITVNTFSVAQTTLVNANLDLKTAHLDMVAALKSLITAVKAFAKANSAFFVLDELNAAYKVDQAWITAQQANL